MQSCWVLYTSFKLPPSGTDASLEDENLLNAEELALAVREARRYNLGLPLDSGSDSDSSGNESGNESEEAGPEDHVKEGGGSIAGMNVLKDPSRCARMPDVIPAVDP